MLNCYQSIHKIELFVYHLEVPLTLAILGAFLLRMHFL